MIAGQKTFARATILRNIRKLSAVIAISAAAISMTACGDMSDSTKDQGKTVICAMGGGMVAQIKTGGAAGKFVAGIVRDNSTGKIRDLAEKVAKGEADEQAVKDLADYVDGLCNK